VDKQEAKNVLADVLDDVHRLPYDELVSRFLSTNEKRVVRASSGTDYDLEIGAAWVDRENGPLRVLVTVDADFCRSWKPMTDEFIVTRDGSSGAEGTVSRLRQAAGAAWSRRRAGATRS
jgi:hypothetical protein